MEVVLLKPTKAERSINVTLLFEGNADLQTTWSVLQPSLLQTRSPWLSLPVTSGDVQVNDGKPELTFNLLLSAAGLRERVEPYVETVSIRASPGGHPDLETTASLEVSLSVQTSTKFIVWGSVKATESCLNRTNSRSRALDAILEDSLAVSLDVVPFVTAFTACDDDGLPVDHQLPTAKDPRKFTAKIGHVDQAVEYVGDGQYHIILSLSQHGAFTLNLQLGQQTFNLSGVSYCAQSKEPMTGGLCGCPIDSEPSGNACIPCKAGQYKPSLGNGVCVDRPLEVWPFLASGGMLLLVVFCGFLLHGYHERKRRLREVELERSFMAITCVVHSSSLTTDQIH